MLNHVTFGVGCFVAGLVTACGAIAAAYAWGELRWRRRRFRGSPRNLRVVERVRTML